MIPLLNQLLVDQIASRTIASTMDGAKMSNGGARKFARCHAAHEARASCASAIDNWVRTCKWLGAAHLDNDGVQVADEPARERAVRQRLAGHGRRRRVAVVGVLRPVPARDTSEAPVGAAARARRTK